MTELTHRIIEFLADRDLAIGLVTGGGNGKLQVLNRNGRVERVADQRVVVVHDVVSESSEFRGEADRLLREIEAARESVDIDLLWESVTGEKGPFFLEELASEYFGQATAPQTSALFRKILEATAHFRLRGLEIYPRTPEEVSRQILSEQRRAEREQVQRRTRDWFQEVFESEELLPVPGEMQELVVQLESFLRGAACPENIRTALAKLRSESSLREAAFEILERLGRLPEDVDRFLLLAGVDARLSAASVAQADSFAHYHSNPVRKDFESLESFSIDDADTCEVDDALTVEANGPNLRVGIHIADVSSFIRRGDALFEQALRRPCSVYLPHLRIPMLPGRFSFDLASLNEGQLRPALSFLVDFDEKGTLTAWNILPSQVRVRHRLSYREVDEVLREGAETELGQSLSRLDELTRGLARQRERAGALNLRQPELKVTVVEDEIQVELLDPESASRRIVSELMILTNQIAAQYAFLHEVPVIYRVQGPPRSEVQVPSGYDPVAYARIFRQLEKGRFSLTRQPHHGLGLPGYTQLTSPIRRLGDLAIQQQITAHLGTEPLPFERQELLEILTQAELGEKQLRSAERRANRFFTLEYLARNYSEAVVDGIVVDRLYNGYLVETDELHVRGRLSCSEELRPGDPVRLSIDRISPEKNVLVFQLHRETLF